MTNTSAGSPCGFDDGARQLGAGARLPGRTPPEMGLMMMVTDMEGQDSGLRIGLGVDV